MFFARHLSNLSNFSIINSRRTGYLAMLVALGWSGKYFYRDYRNYRNYYLNNYGINSSRDITICTTRDDETYPQKGSPGSAGWDLSSNVSVTINPGERKIVGTGLKLNYLPPHFYLRIAPRSGLACQGIDIGAGVVDSDYRGELKVLVINNSSTCYVIDTKTRIAQLIPEYCGSLSLKILCKNQHQLWADQLIKTQRGSGGFGSTGRYTV